MGPRNIHPVDNCVCLFFLCVYTGRQHKVPVVFCGHEEHGLTLIRHRLWPSTISRTAVAFQFILMDWLEALYFECHVPCRNLCQALKLTGRKMPQLVSPNIVFFTITLKFVAFQPSGLQVAVETISQL